VDRVFSPATVNPKNVRLPYTQEFKEQTTTDTKDDNDE
jgi:hypothetical protein